VVIVAGLALLVPACSQPAPQTQTAAPAATTHTPAAPTDGAHATAAPTTPPAPATDPLPLQDMAAAEVLHLNEAWSGDYDAIATGGRRFLRVLVPVSRTFYYSNGPEQHGIAFESLREFEKMLAAQAGGKAVASKVVIVPTSRDRLLPALAAGHGEIAIGGFTVTEARREAVAFSSPTLTGINHIVVAGPGQPELQSVDDLSGREVHVRRSSSYHEDLTALNGRLRAAGKPPVTIVAVDEMLEDEDVLQMVDAGIVPITITKTLYAAFWKQVYDRLTVYDALTVRTDGTVAWAVRRNAPQLLGVVNEFVGANRAGTTFGNVMLTRYLGSANRLKNPRAEEDMKRFRAAASAFQKYGEQYEFDWLVIAAQAYQESRIDQSLRSHAGAVGVMQIKPTTAAEVGIHDVSEMDDNIHAGVKYFRFIVDRYYAGEPMERLDKALFAFASYNAGPAKVRQLRAKAKDLGLNPNVWFNNVELVAGRVIGRETVDYVSNIYKYYTAFKAITAQQARRGARSAAPGTH
jgi:membrane-bound lytic murein transglycosylase MltF